MRFEMQSRDPVTDQPTTILLNSDDITECISYGEGYKVEVHTLHGFHKIAYVEYTRIQPLLMGQSTALPQGVLNLISSMNAAEASAFTAGDRRDSEGLDFYEDMANSLGRELLKALNNYLDGLKEGQS
jgi:hypothetical protein